MKRANNHIAANAERSFLPAKHIFLQRLKQWTALFARAVIIIAFFELFDWRFNFQKWSLPDHISVITVSFLLLSKNTLPLPVQKLLWTGHTCQAEALQSLIKYIHKNLYSDGQPDEGVDKISYGLNKMHGPGNRIF
jgi:hypothetical protein